jgi:LacI family transcriptional regulator, galactose operon repressor
MGRNARRATNGSAGTRRRPTVADVARRAGVGQATAARVLGDYGSASPEARAAVLRAAGEIGYTANAVARSMISGRTYSVGVVVADVGIPYFAEVVRGISDAASADGLQVVLVNTDESPAAEIAAVSLFVERRMDGLIAVPAEREHEHLDAAAAAGVPVVLLDRLLPGAAFDAIVINNRRAAAEAVQRLLDAGHRRVAILTSAPPGTERLGSAGDIWTTTERVAGYEAAMRAAGVPNAEWIVRHAGYNRQATRAAALQLLTQARRPTAIFTTDSVATLGVLDAVQEVGARIPADVSLIGFDDAEWATLVRPRLTVVRQPTHELGARAARALIRRIADPAARPRRQTLAASLVDRESVGRAPARVRRLAPT